jgi:hypothetical protein
MVEVGWLEVAEPGHVVFVRFDRHNGNSAKQRALAAERQRKKRHAHVTLASRSCHAESVTREEKSREEKKEEETTLAPHPKQQGGGAPATLPGLPAATPTNRAQDIQLTAVGWSGISDADMAQWRIAYPACDIASQLARAHAWAAANPEKRKKRWRRFLTNWLARAQERGGDKPAVAAANSQAETVAQQLARLRSEGKIA